MSLFHFQVFLLSEQMETNPAFADFEMFEQLEMSYFGTPSAPGLWPRIKRHINVDKDN